MKNTLSILSLLIISIFAASLISCSDNDSPVDFESYLIGTWRTYKGVVYYDGEKFTTDITKTGEYSGSYMEFTFKQGGTGIGRIWQKDDNGATRWIEEGINYTVSGNTVTIHDEGDPLQLSFDEKLKNLYFRMVTQYDYEEANIYIYFKK